ncbi:bile acid:sodium symporter family protein [Methanobacterium petrolearium]|uniref:bile acid:sodium symporter family protein n=1 Tax=Methanobacterium petrolearium TaxID=710190 RepID=UPI001AE16DCE|nr:bile acid:sodium symporter [Methanobacterium petrolearium]MBP1945894.1 BASS family bile acid:Na+ symporter [Methanobacterium petrolearium]BDZ69551.1 transporter [Methanobacterium petrolearium]
MVALVEFTDFLGSIGVLALFIFIISSMISMGLNYSLKSIISPLKDFKMDLLSIVANFVIIPLITITIVYLFPLGTGLSTGLILIGCAAGAPFLPKLAQIGKGNVPYSIGLMVLLMLITIGFLPLVLPFVLPGVTVNPLDIAKPLVILMLCPMIISMLFRYRYEDISKEIEPFFSKTSSLALFVLVISFFVVYFNQIMGIIGSTAIIASVIIFLTAFVVGYLLGGKDKNTKFTLGVGTSQRNLAAAFTIATTNFNNPEVLTMVIVFGLMALLIIMPLAAETGKKRR